MSADIVHAEAEALRKEAAALEAQADALRRRADVLEASGPAPAGTDAPAEDEGWRSRLHRVHGDTRLHLSEAAEALGVSERTVRRYVAGETDHPALPHAKGPTGLTVRAEDLRLWLEDVEGGNRFRAVAGGSS